MSQALRKPKIMPFPSRARRRGVVMVLLLVNYIPDWIWINTNNMNLRLPKNVWRAGCDAPCSTASRSCWRS